ncbi:MAG: lysophospholipid acyltransferase family protein [Myxococcota bacterium]
MASPADAPARWHTIVDHCDTAPVTDVRNTVAAAGITLLDCSRMLMASTFGGLSDDRLAERLDRWAHHMFEMGHASLEVAGLDFVPPGRCVLMSNHTSLMDPAAMVLAFPRQLSFVAKKELGGVPVFGQALRRLGVVFVDRSKPRRAVAQLAAAKDDLPADRALWIAVEGGRSKDGSLGRFKKGPFHLALQWQVPILPTYIAGTRAMIDAESWSSTTGQRVRVAFGPPIATAGADLTDLRRLLKETQASVKRIEALCTS